jgi:hypothetical protein
MHRAGTFDEVGRWLAALKGGKVIRGAVLLIGNNNRATELFAKRMEQEYFSVTLLSPQENIFGWLKKNIPQAILCTHACDMRLVAKLTQIVNRNKRLNRCPVIYVTDTDVSDSIVAIKGLGEVFRLHQIPLKEAVARLSLAIQLKQCVAPNSRMSFV